MDSSGSVARKMSEDEKAVRKMSEDEQECVVCRESLAELGGATALPCQCRFDFCHRCWDRTLAQSIMKGGVPACPVCRSVVRVDYDAQVGRLIFSKVAEAKVQYSETWMAALAELLELQGLSNEDDGEKFAVMAHGINNRVNTKGLLEAWQKCAGRENMDSKDEEAQSMDTDTTKRKIEELFPLTVTFKEYIILIDNAGASPLPRLEDTFDITPEGHLEVKASVSVAGQWKDHASGVQLHVGDWITEVNGVTGAAQELLEQLAIKDVLRIRVQQHESVLRNDVLTSQNPTRKRLSEQIKPKQLDILRQYGERSPKSDDDLVQVLCVCGGTLQRTGLRQRVHKLVEPQGEDGVMRHAGHKFTVDDLIRMRAVTCDLCGAAVDEGREVWTCETGDQTVLHAHSYDICDLCFKKSAGAPEEENTGAPTGTPLVPQPLMPLS